MGYDIKITGGTIVDGSGGPRYRGDVGISDGTIVALGDAPEPARQVIDAGGKMVSPGFIDIHTHYDAQIIWDRMLTISPWHGVTTVVMGNCGFGIAPTRPEHRELMARTLEKVEGMSYNALDAGLGDWPFETFPEYLDVIEQRGTAINVAAFVGHSPVRLYVMGEDASERAATADEIAQMRAIVREAMDAGALGFATSESPNHVGFKGRPVPSRLAEFGEIETLSSALADAGTGMVQISAGGEIRFDHYTAVAKASGRNVQWTSLLTRKSHPGLHREYLARCAELLADGIPVYPQMSCRELSMEFDFMEPFPMERLSLFEPVSAGDVATKKRFYADPDFRRAFAMEMSPQGSDAGPVVRLRAAWEDVKIAYCPGEPALEDRRLDEIARQRGVDPTGLALDLTLEYGRDVRFHIPLANNDEAGVRELLNDPNTTIGLSDAGAHTSQLCDACFATHLLGHWVREKGAISLEQAVYKMTAKAADIFGLVGRGRLLEGAPADVVVFDADTVAAGKLERVSDLPNNEERLISRATGIEAVIVNGVLLRQGNRDVIAPTAPLPGALLRNGSAPARQEKVLTA